MEYTKGDWKITKWNGGHGFNVFGDDGFVASVPMSTGLKHTMRECQANAQLIAAAPDLYEALKELLDALGNPTEVPPYEVVSSASKALLKTEGK